MKPTSYQQFYKLGLEHFINKHLLGLGKPSIATNAIYITLIILVIVIAQVI